ncbi:MAG: penicillin-binding protein 2 [Alphaproteobacteria bacterium]
MKAEADLYKSFSRRAALLMGGKLALFGVIGARMYQLQVIEAERYSTLSDDNRINLQLIPPPRGRFVDRYGEPLAFDRQNYRVSLVLEKAGSARAVLETLANVLPLTDHELARIVREIERGRRFMPIVVRENLAWDEVAAIEVNAPDLPGVLIDVGRTRYYPYAEAMAHVLGYVGAASEADQDGDALLRLPNFPVGKDGLERRHEHSLRGTAGLSQIEVNAFGRVIRELSREEGIPGREVTLSLDLEIQKFAYERFGEESGALVVMDVNTGEVIALVSVPGFDPNAFAGGIKSDLWRGLLNHPRTPLINKAIAGQYAPGSTFKGVVALAALEAGISPSSGVVCTGSLAFGDTAFHCWKKEGHGAVAMEQAIMKSCDIFFYETARKIGIDKIAEMAKRFGLGRPAAIELPGEKAGVIPSRDWKMATYHQPWANGETLVAGIGQGYVLATPLQLAVMASRLANGGKAVTPRLTREVRGLEDGTAALREFDSMGISPQALEIVHRGMEAVVNTPGGTAYNTARLDDPSMMIAGKTGTSQVRRISAAERVTGVKKNEELPWHMRDHAVFIAYGPVDSPRYAIAVLVEHGGGGSRAAAPIAKDVMRLVFQRDPSRARPIVSKDSGDAA